VTKSVPPPPPRGGFKGSALHHSFAWFERRFGPAAVHAVIAKLPANWRALVKPNERAFGILGARIYPYPFVGDTVRIMRDVANVKDEDEFVRDITNAGVEAMLGTAHRLVVRWLVTPKTFLEHRQDIWDLYHDTGKLNVLSLAEKEYVIQDAEWSNTDPIVCKVNLEGRRRMLGVMGLRYVDARREKCRAWGHATCDTRFRWA
jgi:hypothetical protein